MDTALIQPFGIAPKGEPVHKICLRKGELSCEVITFGATLRTLVVPDKDGNPVDVVLGYDTLERYLSEDGYLGATVGRFANRIAKGTFTLNGQAYTLPINNGNNHLHGGTVGFSHRVWNIAEATSDSVTLTLTSPDGEQGYPGTLQVTAQYTLQEDALVLRHTAVSDQDTPCSITNHTYFNLGGHNSGSATNQKVKIYADDYTPSDPELIPLGNFSPVAGTPLDFRTMMPIQAHVDDPFPQLTQARGYDHNYVIRGSWGTLRPAAIAVSDKTGIQMQVDTTLPGVQLYTGNYVDKDDIGKGGCTYRPRYGFCLETQFYPNSPNQPDFPSCILHPGQQYDHCTVWRFGR